MTRLPAENRDVKGVEGPPYTVDRLCAVDGCSRLAESGGHHIWRRSFLAGAYDWVQLWDGRKVGNKVPLCQHHHSLVTENKAHIKWDNERGFLYAVSRVGSFLMRQPPIWGHPSLDDPNPPEGEHVHGPGSTEKCPTCHRAIRKTIVGVPREKARTRKAWTIAVPVDERENGADVLDTLLAECAKLFGHDEEAAKVRYHTLVQALALVVQNGHLMMRDD